MFGRNASIRCDYLCDVVVVYIIRLPLISLCVKLGGCEKNAAVDLHLNETKQTNNCIHSIEVSNEKKNFENYI